MHEITVSIEEMIEFIYNRCAGNISKDDIEMILDLQDDFLSSKGLIQVEEDELY